MSSSKPVGSILRELRESRGQSLRAAARGLGVDPAYLSRVETGQKPMPEGLGSRAADYYETDRDAIALAQGHVPEDIRDILVAHPEIVGELRRRYATS